MRVVEDRLLIAGSCLQGFPIRGTARAQAIADEDVQGVGLSEALEDDEPADVREREPLSHDPRAAALLELGFERVEVHADLLQTARDDSPGGRDRAQLLDPARLEDQEDRGPHPVEMKEQPLGDLPIGDLLDHGREERNGESRHCISRALVAVLERILGERGAVDPALHLGALFRILGDQRIDARRCVLCRVANLLVRFIDGMAVVDQHGNRSGGVHVQQAWADVLVEARLDQIDVMTLIWDLQLGEA